MQPETAPTTDAFATSLERLVDRLRTVGESRLLRHDPVTGLSLAEQVHQVVVQWAALVEGPSGAVPPRLGPLASGDQLAVVGREVLLRWRAGTLDAPSVQRAWDGLEAVRRAS